ncbi:MAG: hypothetical protein GTN67_00500 [Hydrotalea flava]|uniref:hypothetical protein n=1 Tax=Hydrotalea lipotrueae TaxID=2803817 RepID=UPI0016917EF6|nr:hypothetical protein [Hydrotalea lipotrueae]MBX9732716.1 hypothetical protein [Chitinophagaceae bacterium]NIM33982.1 hypothetical protein [Hydrotalea flava]NIM36811.1 hypothetical protein [Hydrotalea flava]NIN01996.1 hypothetical protein [Hydrotalea flava]NIN13655.1 hypothetical protein [Hydrotalea flava]
MKLLSYLFYRLYQLMISVGNGLVAEYYAIFLMAMTLGLNVYSIISISYLFGYKIDLGLDTGLKIGMCFFVLVLILYFTFLHKKKYLEIVKTYEGENPQDKTKGRLIIIGYLILSFLLLITSMYLMAKKNRGEL